jgi:hypothetical protein
VIHRLGLVLIWLSWGLGVVVALFFATSAFNVGPVAFAIAACVEIVLFALTHAIVFVLDPEALTVAYGRRSRRQARAASAGEAVAETVVYQAAPAGIGGWLVLVAFGLAVAIIFPVVGAWQTMSALFAAGNSIPAGLSLFVSAEAAVNVALIIWIISLNLDFYKQRARFRRGYIAFLLVSTGVVVGDTLVAATAFNVQPDETTARELVRGLIAIAIWVPYMLVSRRAKATFINP